MTPTLSDRVQTMLNRAMDPTLVAAVLGIDYADVLTVMNGGTPSDAAGGGGSSSVAGALLSPLPSQQFNAPTNGFVTVGHTLENVETETGIVLFHYLSGFSIDSAQVGGVQAAIFVDGVKVTGTVDAQDSDAEETMPGDTWPVLVYTDAYAGNQIASGPYANAGTAAYSTGQRGLTMTRGMDQTSGTEGEFMLGSPIMLNLGKGKHTLDVQYNSLGGPVEVGALAPGSMFAVGF